MSDLNPVQALREHLENVRASAVEMLAAKQSVQVADLKDLATIQAALQAIRQTIKDHSGGVGRAGDEETLEKAALDIRTAGVAG